MVIELKSPYSFRRAAPGDDGAMRYTLIENPAYDDVAGARVDVLVRSDLGNNMFPLLRDSGPLMSRSIRLRRDAVRAEALPRFPHVLVGTNGLTLERQAELWDQVTLSSRELDVINSLRLIAPNLDRINLVGSKDDRERSPVVKLSTNDGPVPLRRLGDGVTRVFGMALALVNSKGGILLIDEIENGIHYSVQESLWRFILDVSRRLNVQVFATSHSWDCVKAFQRATAACQAEEGILTRLEMVGRNVVASQFDEDDLAVATRELIEIR